MRIRLQHDSIQTITKELIPCPDVFNVKNGGFSEDAPKLEAALHRAFEKNRVNLVNNRREYFRVSLDEIKRVVRENHDKTVEFIDTPGAEQYRKSLIMAEQLIH